MRLTNTKETYGLIHQLFHWAIAILIITMFALGKYMHELPIETSAEIATKTWWYSLHKTIGMIALITIIGRIIWASIQPHPAPLKGGLEAFAAKAVHWVLYGSMLLMPLAGWLHHAAAEGYAPIWWSFSQDLPFIPKSASLSMFFGIAHHILGFTLAGALFLHIAGAVKHAVIDKDKVLSRMVPGAYSETGTAPTDTTGKLPPFIAAVAVMLVATAVIVGIFLQQDQSANKANTANTIEQPQQVASLDAWAIDKTKSELAIEITQLDSPVKGTFSDWSADVVFDPANPAEAKISATVAIASLKLSDVSDQAISPDFLNAAANPTASFKSTEVTKTDSGFEARGTLTLAGVEQPFTLPFTYEEKEDRAFVQAESSIQRLSFKVGEQYKDDATVGRQVRLIISIEATKPVPSL